jgi:predicted glycosyltransferase
LLDEGTHVVVLARTTEQRQALRALDPQLIIPERAVDGRSLAALGDLVVSAGGTMIREAAVLGTPVWSIFEGRPGAVDEQLVAEGRVRLLRDADELTIAKAPAERRRRGRRDPAELLRLALPDLH